MKHALLATMITALALTGGCKTTLDLPENFVAVEEGDYSSYETRGVSADGTVVSVRLEDNAENGTLAFWAEAVKRQLATRGYTLDKTEDVKSDAGVAGTLMTFTTDRGGRPFTYLNAIFVTPGLLDDGEVMVVEVGGETLAVTPRLADLRAAVLSVR